MKLSDKQLGMDRAISRRDFFNGAAAITAASIVPGGILAADGGHSPAEYPPIRTGLRGSHAGSFEVAHALAWEGKDEWGPVHEVSDDAYDLIVVGAGISGLAAAHFFSDQHADARILILDNHDDFGGHAKRNEFELNGKTIIGYGGSQAMEDPGWYDGATKKLLRDLGVDTTRFEKAYDSGFFRRFGLRSAMFFDEATFGRDQLLDYSFIDTRYLPLAESRTTARQAVAKMPIGENARKELLRLIEARGNHIPEVEADEQWDYLETISYREFLQRHIGINDAEVLALMQGLSTDATASIEMSTAADLIGYVGLPGIKATALADEEDDSEPYIFHFPDGNASIARLLVRQMIPDVANGSTMDDIVRANFDYSKLDEKKSRVRLRLNSTVVNVVHDETADNAGPVFATYVTGGKAYRVRGKFCVMAGYNAMVPYICPQLETAQKDALAHAVKSPIIYTSVLLNNWRALHKLGVGYIAAPGDFYAATMVDFPVSMGGYSFSQNPDEPIVVHMERFFIGDDPTATRREQALAGRRELYSMSFEMIERATRRQLAGALQEGGFDPAADIAAITVNRWPHGYAFPRNYSIDPEFKSGEQPHIIGRQRFGRIAIANSDAGGSATLPSAVRQAHRAVSELRKAC